MNDGTLYIGTAHGVTNGVIDDNVPLTYGHPFAKTSFVMVKIKGTWYCPFEDGTLKNGIVSMTPGELRATAIVCIGRGLLYLR